MAEHSAPKSNRPAIAAAALTGAAIWGVWVFCINRAGMPFVSSSRVIMSFGITGLAFLLLLPVSMLLFSARRRSRLLAAVAFPAVAVLSSKAGVAPSGFDLTGAIFISVATVIVVVVALRGFKASRALRAIAPVAGVLLIVLTQAAAPKVPSSVLEVTRETGWQFQPAKGCPNMDSDYAQKDSGSWMMVSSICAIPAAVELASAAPDGCYTAQDAFSYLALLQGYNAGNFELAAHTAQRMLTAAWISNRSSMDMGFCVKTSDQERVFTTESGKKLFTASPLDAMESLQEPLDTSNDTRGSSEQ
jgi:hypothetical protein